MLPLALKLTRAFSGENFLPSALARKVARSAAALARATIVLRDLDYVGVRARAFGGVHVANDGSTAAGDDLTIGGRFGVVCLSAGAGAALLLGDRVTIDYGSFLGAVCEVVIDDDVMIGPYCVIADGDIPTSREDVRPIYVGPNVWLAARVVVCPGAHIGAGAVISAGSVVEGDIPPNAVASGCPARVLRIRDRAQDRDSVADGNVHSRVTRIRGR